MTLSHVSGTAITKAMTTMIQKLLADWLLILIGIVATALVAGWLWLGYNIFFKKPKP
jgi:hypothetical protein